MLILGGLLMLVLGWTKWTKSSDQNVKNALAGHKIHRKLRLFQSNLRRRVAMDAQDNGRDADNCPQRDVLPLIVAPMQNPPPSIHRRRQKNTGLESFCQPGTVRPSPRHLASPGLESFSPGMIPQV